MCDHEDSSGGSLSFAQLVSLLQRPPMEPCESELEHLTPAEYDESFTEAMRRYSRRVVGFIGRITEDYDNAADLAQDVFLKLYRARVTFEKAYIYRAAKNAAFSELRRRRTQRHALFTNWSGLRRWGEDGKPREFDVADSRPLPDAAHIERLRKEALGRAVERLPEKFRIPLMLYVEGNSYLRITEITQAKEGTVKSRICRGKSILRRRLRPYL